MNSTLAVASRELRERSRLFLVAAALAVVPFIAAAVPAARGQRSLAVASVAMYLMAIFGCGVALTLGISTIGRELSEKRLSFYFARPISSTALWAGKLASALLTSLAVMAIIAVPAMLAARDAWRIAEGNLVAKLTVVGCVVLFLVGHAMSTVVRSRSALLALDFVLLVAAALLVVSIVKPILAGGGMDAALRLISGIAVAIVLILATVPVVQLARGRVDARRNHAALSSAFWAAAGVVLLVATGIALWIVRAPISSLREIGTLVQSPDGRHVMVNGITANRGGYHASFVADTKSGTSERSPMLPFSGPTLSRDGSTVATIELSSVMPGRPLAQVRVRRFHDLETSSIFPIGAPVAKTLSLSDDGTRIAIAGVEGVAVYDVASRDTLAAAALDGRKIDSMFFVRPGLLRLVSYEGGYVFRELDVTNRKLTITGRNGGSRAPVGSSFDGSRMYLRRDSTIVDGVTGAVIARLGLSSRATYTSAMLGDGTVAVTDSRSMHLFDRDGKPLRRIPLPVERATICGELGDSKVLLRTREASYIVDLRRGLVERELRGLRVPAFWAWGSDARLPRFTEDALLTTLDLTNRLALYDVKTGERKAFPM